MFRVIQGADIFAIVGFQGNKYRQFPLKTVPLFGSKLCYFVALFL